MAYGPFNAGAGKGGGGSAADTSYDNSTSGIEASNVQDALDTVLGATLPRLTVKVAAGSAITITDALIRLCNVVTVFFVCRHINNFICYTWILRIRVVYFTIWSLNKSVLVNSCVACQRVDQTDVWSFRRLNRAHTSIMGIMDISYFESGTVSGQTARSQCRKCPPDDL